MLRATVLTMYACTATAFFLPQPVAVRPQTVSIHYTCAIINYPCVLCCVTVEVSTEKSELCLNIRSDVSRITLTRGIRIFLLYG